jgi:hypothetical protein
MKEQLLNYYYKFRDSIEEMVYLSLILKKIIDNVEDDEEKINELELDLMNISLKYGQNKEKTYYLKKQINDIIDYYNIEISSIDSETIEELIESIIEKSNK